MPGALIFLNTNMRDDLVVYVEYLNFVRYECLSYRRSSCFWRFSFVGYEILGELVTCCTEITGSVLFLLKLDARDGRFIAACISL